MEISMNKLYRIKPLVILFSLTILLLTACSTEGQSSPAASPTQPAEASVPETETQPTQAETTEIESTEVAVSASGGSSSAAGSQMECTLVSDQPDVAPELEAIFGVTEDDWVIGPDSAAVTFVEYSDFQ
jgi:protein-disulfide isomerase